jgi:transcriptional regulator with XRE-family HTH domain
MGGVPVDVNPAARPGETSAEENIARRIEWEMSQRGWSQERLSKEMSDAGCPLHQSSISKIVRPRDGKRRTISFDEAVALAKVFNLTLDDLRLPIEVIRSREVYVLIHDIERVNYEQEVLRNRQILNWARFRDMMANDEVKAAYVEWMHATEGVEREEVVRDLDQWARDMEDGRSLVDLGPYLDMAPRRSRRDVTSLRTILEIRRFVTGVRSNTRSGIQSWLDKYTPEIVRADFTDSFARLVNRQLTGRGVSDELLSAVVRQIDLYMARVTTAHPGLRDEWDLEALAASVAVRFDEGEALERIAESVGVSPARLREALIYTGLIPKEDA